MYNIKIVRGLDKESYNVEDFGLFFLIVRKERN